LVNSKAVESSFIPILAFFVVWNPSRLQAAQLMSQATNHTFRMRSLPVELPAVGTSVKPGDRLKDIIRHLAENFRTVDAVKKVIASYAPAQELISIDLKLNLRMQLAHLIQGIVLIQADNRFECTPSPSARQHDPSGVCILKDLRVAEGFKSGVIAEDTQPLRHFSEHAIDHKTFLYRLSPFHPL
jgi:hypothetical protein